MRVALACTWRPHGELPRLQRVLPAIHSLYAPVIVSLIDSPADSYDEVRRMAGVEAVLPRDGAHSRMAALRAASSTSADYVHYCDMDRLIRWAETQPGDLRETVKAIPSADCLVLGRTEAAYATHPEAMRATERIINEVCSHALGIPVDICAGSKGLSMRLVRLLVARAAAEGWGDFAWAALAQHAGFTVAYRACDGLDYETADRYRPRAADAFEQRRLASEIDGSPEEWKRRVRVAQEILAEGLRVHVPPADMP